jgi:hypothetical protein
LFFSTHAAPQCSRCGNRQAETRSMRQPLQPHP